MEEFEKLVERVQKLEHKEDAEKLSVDYMMKESGKLTMTPSDVAIHTFPKNHHVDEIVCYKGRITEVKISKVCDKTDYEKLWKAFAEIHGDKELTIFRNSSPHLVQNAQSRYTILDLMNNLEVE